MRNDTSRPRFDLTAFGESMLRLSPPAGETLETAARLDAHVAGAEGNVLCALAQVGFRCGFGGALPASALGRRVARAYRACGVVVPPPAAPADARLGVYFLQPCPAPFAARATYDRRDSAAARAAPDDLDWDFLLAARAIHLTGVTAAISPRGRACVESALEKARRAKMTIGFDVNHRALLWDEKTARETLTPMIRGVDVLFCSRRDAARIFECDDEDARAAIAQLAKKTGARQIAMTDGARGAFACANGEIRFFPAPTAAIVDRVGAGDAFAAGVWSGILGGSGFFAGLPVGIVFAARALTQQGDIATVCADDLSPPPPVDFVR